MGCLFDDGLFINANELYLKILVKGDIQDINDKAVVAETMVICTLQGMLLDAVVAYMAVNYVFMFDYHIGFNHFCLLHESRIVTTCHKFASYFFRLRLRLHFQCL